MSNSKLLAGFLIGAAVGGALGILLAPDKGVETRKKIMKKGSDIGESLSDLGSSIKGKFNDLADDIKDGFSKARGGSMS